MGYPFRPPEPEPEEEPVKPDTVANWRVLELAKLGFNEHQSEALREVKDVVHEAQLLIEQGCPVDIAFDILS